LRTILRENRELRRALYAQRERATQDREAILQTIGSDLHDGPAQYIGSAILRLGVQENDGGLPWSAYDAQSIRRGLIEAERGIRDICAGLSTPDVDNRSVREVIACAIEQHIGRTGIAVEARLGRLPLGVPRHVKICLYRLVQEGLNNAIKHAAGVPHRVIASRLGERIVVQVEDNGKPNNNNLENHKTRVRGDCLGLAGLRARFTDIGGRLDLISESGGTVLRGSVIIREGHYDQSRRRRRSSILS
jgi:signal transduction histidine kinase